MNSPHYYSVIEGYSPHYYSAMEGYNPLYYSVMKGYSPHYYSVLEGYSPDDYSAMEGGNPHYYSAMEGYSPHYLRWRGAVLTITHYYFTVVQSSYCVLTVVKIFIMCFLILWNRQHQSALVNKQG